MDVIARRLGLDPAEVRRRNLIPAGDMPYDRGVDALGSSVVYDSGDYEALLDRVLEYLDYEQLSDGLAERRAAGESVGIGFGYFIEKSGLGPFDGVRVTVDEAGQAVIVTGVSSVGQGVETALAQICADHLGVPLEAVRVRCGQTDDLPYGMGSFAQPGDGHDRIRRPDRRPAGAGEGPGRGGAGVGSRRRRSDRRGGKGVRERVAGRARRHVGRAGAPPAPGCRTCGRRRRGRPGSPASPPKAGSRRRT